MTGCDALKEKGAGTRDSRAHWIREQRARLFKVIKCIYAQRKTCGCDASRGDVTTRDVKYRRSLDRQKAKTSDLKLGGRHKTPEFGYEIIKSEALIPMIRIAPAHDIVKDGVSVFCPLQSDQVLKSKKISLLDRS